MKARQASFGRSFAASKELDAVQERQRSSAAAQNACPFLRGVLRSVTFAAATAKAVSHGLGAPAACIVVRQNYDPATASVRMTEASPAFQATLDPSSQLGLICDAACTLDLWFYPRASEVTPR